jgi:hypothetical protein
MNLLGLVLTQSIIASAGYAGNGTVSAPQLRIANCELRIFQTPDSGFRNPKSEIRNPKSEIGEPVFIRGAFMSWGPSEQVAVDLRESGLTEPCYYFNAGYERASEDADDFHIKWKADPLHVIQGWEQLARQYDLNLLTCINSWAGDEGPMFTGKNYRHLVTINGHDGGVPCPTDLHYWDVVAQQMEMIADVGPGIKGCLLDTETYNAGSVYPGYGAQKYNECYCDHCFSQYLAARGLEQALPSPADRFKELVKQGRADDYEAFMEEQMIAVGRQLGARVRARRADFVLGILNTFGWHSRGLVQGLAENGDPVLVWGENTYWNGYAPAWEGYVQEYQALGPRVRVVGGLALSGWGPQGLALQGAQLAQHAEGYWLFCANSLFATRQQQEEAQSVWRLKALYADRYYAALRKLNRAVLDGLPPPPTEPGDWSSNLLENLAEGSVGNGRRAVPPADWSPFEAPELLWNGGFEEDFGDLSGDAVHRWHNYYAWPQRVAEQPHSGGSCCRLENNDPERPCSISQTFPAQPGQSYRFRGAFRTDYLVSGQGLYIHFNGAEAGRWRGHFPQWTPFEVTATCPPDAQTMSIGIEMHYTLGTVWLDDLSVTLSPRRILLTQPFSLSPGRVWGHLRWQAEVPEGARLRVDLIDPGDQCPVAPDVQNGQSLDLLNHVTTLPALQVRVTVEPDEAGRYPTISDLRVSTRPGG